MSDDITGNCPVHLLEREDPLKTKQKTSHRNHYPLATVPVRQPLDPNWKSLSWIILLLWIQRETGKQRPLTENWFWSINWLILLKEVAWFCEESFNLPNCDGHIFNLGLLWMCANWQNKGIFMDLQIRENFFEKKDDHPIFRLYKKLSGTYIH